jgi:hypothetical protein
MGTDSIFSGSVDRNVQRRAGPRVGAATIRICIERSVHPRKQSIDLPSTRKNKHGDVHEHVGYFSCDKGRTAIVLRQFHAEGFVNQYVLAPGSTATKVVFESERLENFSNEWRAKETYEIVSKDEFIETFELAAPGNLSRFTARVISDAVKARRDVTIGQVNATRHALDVSDSSVRTRKSISAPRLRAPSFPRHRAA